MSEERVITFGSTNYPYTPVQNCKLELPALARVTEVTSKKMSPLKHVSPILKKYNTQRHVKSVKTVRTKPKKEQVVKLEVSENIMDIKEEVAPNLDSSSVCLEVSCEPFVDLHDSSVVSDPHNASRASHATATESLSEEARAKTEDESSDQIPGSSPTSKGALSGSSNPKIVKLTHQERKMNRFVKKRNRIRKDLEHTMPLIAADDRAAKEKKCHDIALSYFIKTKERLSSDEERLNEFLRLMSDFSSSNYNVVDLYHRIAALLFPYPDLCEEFLAFLLPDQALQCGRFMEHLGLAEMMSFLRKLEVYFIKQPHHLRKIYSCWTTLSENPNLTLEEVRCSIIPLLRGNKLLEDSFMELLPGARPPESKMDYGGGPDVECLLYEDMDSELSDEDERSERIDIPGAKSDSYGGDSCQCCCHDSVEHPFASRTKHCVPCGLKFIAGKVYLQTENGLRPIRVNFGEDSSYNSNLKRLNPDTRKAQRSRGPKRGRAQGTRSAGTLSKDNSPVKGVGKGTQEDKKPPLEAEEESAAAKSKSPRSHRERPKSIPSRSKEKAAPGSTPMESSPTAAGRCASQGSRPSARSRLGSRGKVKLCPSPPAAPYDEIALPATEPTAAKSDATDFSVLCDVLRQERREQEAERLDGDAVRDESFAIGSDDSVGGAAASDSAGVADPGEAGSHADAISDMSDVSEVAVDVDVDADVDGDVDPDVDADADADGDGDVDADVDADSDEAMSVDSFGESDGESEGDKSDSREAFPASQDGSSEEDSQESQPAPSQAWTREEDRIILQTFQAEPDVNKTFVKIKQSLPARTIDEIKKRFHVLLQLIQQLT